MSTSRRIGNPAEFGNVAVALGGAAAEREISLHSGRAVLKALVGLGIRAHEVDVGDAPIQAFHGKDFDRVFNMVHGRGGEDGVLQGILEALQLPYTGSGVLGSALSMDKLKTKLCWRGAGIPTPDWLIIREQQDIDVCAETLGFPVIVKPAQEGSSIGMSKAENPEQLSQAWKNASGYDCDVFAEAWVEGNEYTVAILDQSPLPMIRLGTSNVFYDYDAKYRSETTQYHCPCGLDSSTETTIQVLSIGAAECLGVSGWSRVDMLVDNQDRPWLIEVNTVPGMTDHSLVPMAAKAAGIEFPVLVWRILETSLKDNA